jgi:hypothetical protein
MKPAEKNKNEPYIPYTLHTSAMTYETTMAAYRAMDAGNIDLMNKLGEQRTRMLMGQAPGKELEALLAEAARSNFSPRVK